MITKRTLVSGSYAREFMQNMGEYDPEATYNLHDQCNVDGTIYERFCNSPSKGVHPEDDDSGFIAVGCIFTIEHIGEDEDGRLALRQPLKDPIV